jgi:hypothetical protein
MVTRAGLKDVIFYIKKLGTFWSFLMEDVGRYISWTFVKFYGPLVYFVNKFWYIFPVLVCCTKKNLATLAQRLVFEPTEKFAPSQD